MFKRNSKSTIFLFIIFVLLALWLSPVLADKGSPSNNPRDAVEQAWRQASEIGRYDYRSTAKQITYPAPSRTNAGQLPQEDNLAAEGFFDSEAEELNFTIWRDGSFNPETGIEIRSDGEKTWSRRGQGEWEEMQDVSSAFLPGGDPLGFFYGMRNIQDAGPDVRSFPNAGFELTFQRYTFDFDGPAFGRYITEQNEALLREKGDLPYSAELDVPQIYAQATGSGEIWLDETGLPARLKLSVNYGQQENGESIESYITTDYFGYEQDAIAVGVIPFAQNPANWLNTQVSNPDFQQSLMMMSGFFLLLVVVIAVTRRYWWTRTFYAAFSIMIIMVMLVGPLLNAEQLHAFGEHQYETQLNQEAAQAQVEEQQEMIEAIHEVNFDPKVDPRSKTHTFAEASKIDELSLGSENSTANLVTYSDLTMVQTNTTAVQDTDNDGLSDADEDLKGTCDGTDNDPAHCASVAHYSDTDGDGLTDAEEVLVLGTIATSADSDGDTIEDYLEVTGFTDSNGVHWYMNPMDSDSNKDGKLDGMECPALSASNPDYSDPNHVFVCPDTDGDGDIDIFDDDNDGDGVEDSVDHSPFDFYTGFSQTQPLEIAVENLMVDKPVIVTIELRPEQAEDLASYGHILDWPSGDRMGQIQRISDTNWNTSTNYSISEPNGAYGDIRLTPMLEIAIDASVDNPGNLPLKSGIERTSGMTVTQWLDEDALAGYGVTVRDVYDEDGDPTGDLIAYASVMPFSNSDGDETAGFAAKMLYQPSEASTTNTTIAEWGNAHNYRLVWLVEMLTDPCPAGNFDCEDSERLRDQYTIIHNYYENWNLTGFSISEQHGLKAAIMAKDPDKVGASNDLNYPAEQTNLAYNLAGTFVTGRDCGSVINFTSCTTDTNRDVTIDTMDDAIDDWTSGTTNPYYLKDDISYAHKDYLIDVASTEARSVLTTQYNGSYASATPTLLFAYEYTERTIGLDTAQSGTGVSPSLDMGGVEKMTIAGMNWGSYRQVSGAWEIIPQETFITELDAMLQDNETYFTAVGSQAGLATSEDAAVAAQGKRMFMQLLYASVFQGMNGVVAIDGESVATPEAQYPAFLPTTGANIGFANEVTEDFLDSFNDGTGNPIKNGGEFWKNYAKARNFLVSDDLNIKSPKGSLQESLLNKSALMGNALGSAIALASIVSFTAYIFCSSCQDWAGVVINSAEIASNLADLGRMMRVFASADDFPLAVKNFAGSGAVVTIVVTIITLAILWGVYLAEYAGKPDSLQKHLARVVTTAATFVTVAFTIVSLLVMAAAAAATGVGAALTIVILVFLAVLGIWEAICGLASTCTGPISAITEWFANLFVKIDEPMIINMDSEDRLDISYENLELVDIDEGFTSDNQLDYTMKVINVLETYEDPDASDSRRAVFEYSLQENTNDPNPDLTIGSIPKCPADPVCYEVIEGIRQEPYQTCVEWKDGDYVDSDSGGYYEQECVKYGTAYDPITGLRMVTTVSHAVDLSNSEGINTNIGSQLYVGESFSLPFEVCSIGGDCKWYGTKEEAEDEDETDDEVPGWNPIPLGEGQTFDVLPATLNEFVSRNWNSGGSIALPTQKDADNDGILSIAHGGEDPDDSSADIDGDGLTDGFEILLRTDPQIADSDDDGINDGDEFRYGTDPRKSDSDGDGLIDGEEVAGWLFTYKIDENGTRIQTRVWSDPLARDTDGDQLSDLQERLLTFNPIVADDPSVVENLIQIEEFEVNEQTAPIAIWHLDESEFTTAYADRSGNSQTASCDAGSCPTAGVDGRYGQALDFNGSQSIAATLSTPLANESFTISAWAKRDTSGTNDYILSQGQATASKGLHFGFRDNNKFTCAFWGNDLDTSATYTDSDWHHWACTYDAETKERKIYRDGQLVADDKPNTPYQGNGPVIVGMRMDNTNHFDGMIDEVAIYHGTFSAEMISGLAKGGYYLNDLYVLPGASLDYQVTITNTHTEEASGLLFNEANTYRTIDNPVSVNDATISYEESLASPDVVLHLDNSEVLTTFVNSRQDTISATCGIGTCPVPAKQVACDVNFANKTRCPKDGEYASDEILPPVGRFADFSGKYRVPVAGLGEFMAFDGDNDFISIPQMSIGPSVVIGFWVRVEELPANGEKAYLLYSEPDVGYSLYVDHQGSIYYDSGSGTATKMHHFNEAADFDPNIKLVPGKWRHILIKTSTSNYGEFMISPPYDDNDFYDGDDYFVGAEFPFKAHVLLDSVDPPQFGPGLIGNNAAGNGGFNGQITAFALYQSPELTLSQDPFSLFDNQSRTSWMHMRENDKYEFDGQCNGGTCEIAPTLQLKFEDWGNDSLVTLQSAVGGDAYCETTQSCPRHTTTSRGEYNEALDFDGNDHLILDGIDLANRSFTIAAWAKRDTTGAHDFILGQGKRTQSQGLHFGFRSNNTFTCAFWANDLTTTTTYTDTDWHHWICSYDAETNSRSIYRDGELVVSDIAVADYQGSGPLYIGDPWSGANDFDGSLDEIIIIPDALDEEGVGAKVLASSRYPYVDITTGVDTDYQAFALPSNSDLTLTGSIEIDENLPSHVQRFQQQVDATLGIASSVDTADGTNVVFHLPFNEDLSNLSSGSCVIVGECPLGGFAGVNGRSALFDGVDDGLKINNGAPATTKLTVSAWVKADQGTIVDMREMDGRSIGDFPGWNGLEVDVDVVKLHGRNSTAFVPYTLPNNEWAHLTIVVDKGTNWTVAAYVNGVQAGTTASIAANEVDNLGSGLAVVGMQKNMAHLLDGYLDSLYVYNTAFSATQVQALYEGSRPILSMHFDESANETAVVNDFGGIGNPSSDGILGVEGRLGNGIYLDGETYLTLEGLDEINNLNNAFTIMAWVRPEALGSWQRILAHGRTTSNNGFSFGFKNSNLVFTTNAVEDYVSSAVVADGEWQHVAVVFDNENDAHFYLNGGFVDEITDTSSMNLNSDDPIFIGAIENTSGVLDEQYVGDLDELIVYDRMLTAGEIAEAFQWQFRTYREVGSAYITIDDDTPTVALTTNSNLRANSPTWLSVEVDDPSSPITRLEIGQSGLNNSNIVWQDAPVCIDDTDAWCPQFAPSGEGTYQVQFRAVDAVGHFATSSQSTFYVDATAPTIALDNAYNNQFLDATRPSELELRWVLPLAGTISDPMISGTTVAGSGVNTETAAIQIKDAAGNIVGNSSQRVIVDTVTGSWSVDYEFLTVRPFGQYTVELLAEDMLGQCNRRSKPADWLLLVRRKPTYRQIPRGECPWCTF